MTIINLKEMYSNYYIRKWKKQGLPLITERPPTTTQEILDRFFMERRSYKESKNQRKAIFCEKKQRRIRKLDWKDYIKEEYK